MERRECSALLPKAKVHLAARHSARGIQRRRSARRRRNYLIQALVGVALAVLTVIALS
jgi:hypothetical protein